MRGVDVLCMVRSLCLSKNNRWRESSRAQNHFKYTGNIFTCQIIPVYYLDLSR